MSHIKLSPPPSPFKILGSTSAISLPSLWICYCTTHISCATSLLILICTITIGYEENQCWFQTTSTTWMPKSNLWHHDQVLVCVLVTKEYSLSTGRHKLSIQMQINHAFLSLERKYFISIGCYATNIASYMHILINADPRFIPEDNASVTFSHWLYILLLFLSWIAMTPRSKRKLKLVKLSEKSLIAIS